MEDQLMGRCGIDCSACEYRTSMDCPGCAALQGKAFWGECKLAKCCTYKRHDHCGQCAEFPCDSLKEFSYDPQQGDNGKRISNCREWNEKGIDAWRKEQSGENSQ